VYQICTAELRKWLSQLILNRSESVYVNVGGHRCYLENQSEKGVAMKLLRKKDVARRVGVSIGTLENLVRRGEMPRPLNTAGSRVVWNKSTIDDWLNDSSEMPDRGGLVTIAELASVLGVSTKTVRRMVTRQEIPPPIRVGRQLRWRPSDLTKWLAELPVDLTA
jgi:excisionase family DNA binding protein